MSQSPIDDFSEQATLSYKQGWRALNRLLHEDRSFSGHERHCAFLNTGGNSASFADVSAVTAFDFADDGRGLATADWDFDGDLDIWITNRTAPRVRLLKNNTPPAGHFVAIKLHGDGIASNRDAIGARVELYLAGSSGAPKRIRTLHGGEGFLSQSSNWLHFGTGDATSIDKLIVRWPGAPAEEFAGLELGHFYHLTQGQPAAQPFSPPANRAALTAQDQRPQPVAENTRTIVPTGLPFPQVDIVAPDGSAKTQALSNSRATLINLWSSTCAPCLAELTDWSQHSESLAAAGADVLTLSTDHLAGTKNPTLATASALAKTGSTFTNLPITEDTLQTLDDLQRAVLDRWKPLPVPTTFLVSASGELIALYKGPVAIQTLLEDIPLTRATAATRRDAAIPFPGRWVGEPSPTDPKRVASIMLDHDRIDTAIHYLEQCVKVFAPLATDADHRRQLGDIYFMAGLLNSSKPGRRAEAIAQLTSARELIPTDLRIRTELGKQLLTDSKPREALAEFTAAAEINPSDLSLRQDLGILHFQLGDYEQARSTLEAVVAAAPQNGVARYHLANAEVRTGQLAAAIASYRKTLSAAPDIIDAANNLAWILAAHPDEKLRSPDEALALAKRLCSLTKEKNPQFLDTLSVALANRGEFQAAITAANKAIALHPPENQAAADQIRARIARYESSNPYREAAWQ